MVCSIVRTSACRALFVRYSLSSLPACLTSTLFTSCSSTAPLSGLANLFTMKSSGETSSYRAGFSCIRYKGERGRAPTVHNQEISPHAERR